jgi:hypothetical protein
MCDYKPLQFSSLVEDLVRDEILPNPMSRNHDPNGSFEITEQITWRVKRISNLEALKVFRFLLTQVTEENRELSTRELFVCFEYSSFLETQKDRSFLAKHGEVADACIRYFDFIRKQSSVCSTSRRAVLNTLKFSCGRSFLFSPHALWGMRSTFKPMKFLIRDNRAFRRKSFESKHVGVGYKDKGNKRVPHYDGSPAWQEVAASNVFDQKHGPLISWSKRYFRARSRSAS